MGENQELKRATMPKIPFCPKSVCVCVGGGGGGGGVHTSIFERWQCLLHDLQVLSLGHPVKKTFDHILSTFYFSHCKPWLVSEIDDKTAKPVRVSKCF